MIYTVTWQPSALAELAELWNVAHDRDAVGRASNRIDIALKWDAHDKGESRSGRRRVYFDRPLGVRFECNEQDREARVLAVWRIT